ncbi:MAG: polysaccharide lyase [Bacteroidales bacterium]|nr:polysaccharide lyase [Bacteroidales bacterium]
MKKNFLLILSLLLVSSISVFAQYPSVPKEVQDSVNQMMKKEWESSDKAFEKALPIIEKEAKEGRPYIPWASRPCDLPQADIPAFPGAYGGGAYSFGGRGGKVLVVTSLEDRGPGTLREACEQGGARIIVFNVAGIIHLKTPLIIRAPYITIAGQTAPGDGVCIAGESMWINTHDVVLRHLKFRRGETWVGRRDDALGGNPIGNIMIDHCSTSWGLDENISFYRHMFTDPGNGKELKLPTVNVTIQNTISSQALDTYNHSFGSTLGGENCTFMRNIWANNAGRNPSIGWNGVFNFANNLIYNWVHRNVDGGDFKAVYNIINNYYKPGPLTPKSEVGYRIIKPEARMKDRHGRYVFGRVYAGGNIMEGNERVTKDNWDGGVQPAGVQKLNEDYIGQMKLDKPYAMENPFPIMSAEEAYSHVLENAGAYLPKRDIVDERVFEQIKTGKVYYEEGLNPNDFYQFKHRRLPADSYKHGIITDIKQVGGYPEYKGTPYKDSDNDGIPDEWERKYGLDPFNPSDATEDMNGDGYTNIEKYINGIDPTKKVDWTNPENNHDTLKNIKSFH